MQSLWTRRGPKFFLLPFSRQDAARTLERLRLRAHLRLFRPAHVVESSRCRRFAFTDPRTFPPVPTHHYEEEIAGRTYHIEVQAISREQWRAKLARRPGMPTALMPFYGATPELAARELTKWLSHVAAQRAR